MDAAPPRYRTVIGATSLILGPALMSVGDLFHPEERWDAAAQVAIVAESGSRWYLAHHLLFVGMLLFIPGILALTKLVHALLPALLAFFVGTALAVMSLASFRSISLGGTRHGARQA